MMFVCSLVDDAIWPGLQRTAKATVRAKAADVLLAPT